MSTLERALEPPTMGLAGVINDTIWILDPYGHYGSFSENDILQSLGLIPLFIINEEGIDVEQKALELYGFHLGGTMGGTVLPNGAYSYPGDPDLQPLALCLVNKIVVLVYQYGITSFINVETMNVNTYRFD